MSITEDMLSSYSKDLLQELGSKADTKTRKLILNLYPKKHYVIHYITLKKYLEWGMVLDKVHRVLSFEQSAFIAPYIMLNSELRKKATSTFDKDFFKLMNNALFGKTMENRRHWLNIDLVTHEKRLLKLISSPSYKRSKIMNDNLVAVERSKVNLVLKSPIQIGMAVLDLSKAYMYSFYYDIVVAHYGKNVSLAYTDTDSLIMNITTHDFFESLFPI